MNTFVTKFGPKYKAKTIRPPIAPTSLKPNPEHLLIPGAAYKVAYKFNTPQGEERRNFVGRCVSVKKHTKSPGRTLTFWNIFFGFPVEFKFYDPSPFIEFIDRIPEVKPIRTKRARLSNLKDFAALDRKRVHESLQ